MAKKKTVKKKPVKKKTAASAAGNGLPTDDEIHAEMSRVLLDSNPPATSVDNAIWYFELVQQTVAGLKNRFNLQPADENKVVGVIRTLVNARGTFHLTVDGKVYM